MEQTTNQGFHKPNTGDYITDDRLWKTNWDNLDTKLTNIDSMIENNVVNLDVFVKQATDIDDSERIQRAMDYAVSVNKPLILNGGIYIVHSINVPVGLTLIGNGATFKRPNLRVAPYNKTVSEMNWIRMFTISHASGTDSPLTRIYGCNFDGNCWEQWDTPSYDQEQASILFGSGDRLYAGRLRLHIKDCYFSNSVSDGIHVASNIDAQIDNCSSFDCFRGGLTITGGYSLINVNNFRSQSDQLPDGIDSEIDSRGYGDSYVSTINMNNIIVDTDFDFQIRENSIANLNNIVLSKEKGTYMLGVGIGSVLNMTNSTMVGKESNANYDRLLLTGEANFKNCNFYLRTGGGGTSCLYVYTYGTDDPNGVLYKSWKLNLDGCNFSYLGSDYATVNIKGIETTINSVAYLKINNCFFDHTLNEAVRGQVKRLEMVNSAINTKGYGIRWTTSSYNPDSTVIIDNLEILNDATNYLYVWTNVGYPSNIIHKNMVLHESKNKMSGSPGLYSSLESADNYQKFLGKRTIHVDHDPNTSPYVKGIVGDIAVSTQLVENGLTKTWRCVRLQNSSSPWNSIWLETTGTDLM